MDETGSTSTGWKETSDDDGITIGRHDLNDPIVFAVADDLEHGLSLRQFLFS